MSTYFSSHGWRVFRFVVATVLLASGEDVVFAQEQRALGLDVSAWQGGISQTTWNNIRNVENRQFVFIRSSRGGTTGYYNQNDADNSDGLNTLSQRYDDPYFVQNVNRSITAGMFAGPYHFSRPDIISATTNSGGIANTGADEADHFIQMAGAWMRPGYLVPIHDVEAGQTQRTANELAQFIVDFSDRIYERMGIRPGTYIGGNYANYIQGASLSLRNEIAQPPGSLPSVVSPCYPYLWSARWPNQTDPNSIDVQNSEPKDSFSTIYGPWDDYGVTHPWKFWQYASTLRLQSFNNGGSNLDADVARGGAEFLKDQLVPAVWWNDISGAWTTLTNWNSGQTPVAPVTGPGQVTPVATGPLPTPRLPSSNDTVILERPNSNITITLSSGAQNIRKLYTREALDITGGSLTINYLPSWDSTTNGAQFSAPVSLSGSATLSVYSLQVDTAQTFTAGNGTLKFSQISLMPGPTPATIALNGNMTLQAFVNGTGNIVTGSGTGTSGRIDLSGGNRVLTVASGSDLSIDVPVQNGTLTKAGTGTLRLGVSNTYAGGTTVSAGTLLVTAINGSATGSGNVTVNSGSTLGGSGNISGTAVISSGATLSPGIGTNLGMLTFSNGLTLSGNTSIKIDRNGGSSQSDRIVRSSGTQSYGGTLTVANVGATLLGGEVFTIFSAPSYNGAFNATNLPPLNNGLNWDLGNLTTDGTIRVNRRPVANGAEFTKIPGQVLQIPKSGLAGSGSDPDGDSLSLASFDSTTTNGVVLTADATFIYYSNSATVPDRFNYVLSDGHGGTNTGVVQITPQVATVPSIVTGPANRTNNAGTTATFNVSATGSSPLSYQWQKGAVSLMNLGNVSGATTSTLMLNNVSQNDATNYSVIVSNAYGSVTSAPAALVVIDPPSIETQPQSLSVQVGSPASFSVAANGSGSLSYQWSFNGDNLSGASGSSFTRVSALSNHVGDYTVVITNSAGSVTSTVATLNVTGALPFVTLSNIWNIQAGSRSYVTTGSTERGIALNPISNHTLLLSRSPEIIGSLGIYILDSDTGAELGTMSVAGIANNGFFVLNKIGVAEDGVIYAGNMTTASATTNFVLYRWADENATPTLVYSGAPDASLTARWGDSFDVRGSGTNTQIIVGGPLALKVAIFTTADGTNFTPNPVGPTVNSGRGLAFGAGNSFFIKYTGNYATNYGFNLPSTSASVITNLPGLDGGLISIAVDSVHNLLAGVLDDNSTNTSGHRFKVYNVANPGVPTLVSNFNFLPFGSGTNSTNPNAVGAVDTDGSRVIGLDTQNGIVALKIVYAYPPEIVAQPVSCTNNAGSIATFTVEATSDEPIVYQWTKNDISLSDGGNVVGANSASLTVSNVYSFDAGTYKVVVSNTAGSNTSAVATLTVIDPVIMAHPTNRTAAASSTVTFSAAAEGTAPLSCRWCKNNSPLANGGNISGADTFVLTLNAITAGDAANYSVIVSNASGSVTSSNAILTIPNNDSIAPTIAFTVPAKTNSGVITLKGTAKDTAPGVVTEVWYRLNSDPEFSPANLIGTASKPGWESPGVTLLPGTNFVYAYAVDAGGNHSATISKKFFYDTTDFLTVNIIGGGGVKTSSGASVVNGQQIPLLVGRPASLTAFISSGTTATNYVFSNWFGTITTNTPTINFIMQSNMVLNAQFITNPFVPVSGKYYGLFYETNGVATHRTAGFITFNVTSKASFSGKVLLDGNVVSFSGKFDLSGHGSKILSRATKFGKSALTLDLVLDWSTSSQKAFGTIGDGSWTSQIEADRTPFSATNPAVNFVGRYTMLIPRTNYPAVSPSGFGYGLITNSLLGKVVLSGRAGDGAVLSQSVWLSKDGRWPLYVPLYKNTNSFTNGSVVGLNKADYRGSMLGWITFTTPNDAPTGAVSWIKTEVPASDSFNVNYFYPAGFTNLLDIIASPFHTPGIGTRLLQFTNAMLVAANGNLSSPIGWNATLASNNAVTVFYAGSDKVTLTLNNKTGQMKGTFLHPNNGNLTTTFWGAVMQDQNYAAGEFPGKTELNSSTNQTGSVFFSGN